ncbi:class I SAM-dependent methyltransferase [Ramlibacter albus]|uniref:SAM-dependent methyltransferase n=1 Tax=Ramlibacter albus TaxID=2079448 RepID=A0A923M5Y5_9BURK|nr:class I SAM-dependent methyltransferase [Ramlibacter albus]MBC5763376.1 SAM-dependent methyltransferase [Ramlibacter albus]
MSDAIAALHGRIARYYGAKLARHGPTPRGVDWPSAGTQALRLEQLLRLCDFASPFTLNDLGCGYGALLGLLRRTGRARGVDYLGTDVSPAMVAQARALWRGTARFEVGGAPSRVADYSVASGIFNVRIDEPRRLWEDFVAETLVQLAFASRRGFAVNFLKPLPRGTDDVPELYRPPPRRWAAFCEDELGLSVETVAGYGLREVTLFARH